MTRALGLAGSASVLDGFGALIVVFFFTCRSLLQLPTRPRAVLEKSSVVKGQNGAHTDHGEIEPQQGHSVLIAPANNVAITVAR